MKKVICFMLVCALGFGLFGLSGCAKNAGGLSHYEINAVLTEDKNLTVDLKLDYRNNTEAELGELMLHLYPNAYREGARFSPVASDRIAEAYPRGRSYSVVEITSVSAGGKAQDPLLEGQDEDILVVNFEKPLKPTQRTTVRISYTVRLPQVRHRFGYYDKTVNLGNFYPVACVYEDGMFVTDPYYSNGDPFYSECADYNVTFTAPKAYKGAFTGRITNEQTGEENTVYKIKAEKVRDFAAVFGEFSVLSGNAGSTIVNYYYYDDTAPEAALKAGIDSINTFSELFGAYAYPQFSIVKTAFLEGGMEYPGLVYVSDRVQPGLFKEVIIHETAHQWWYAAVGNNEVAYPWLDEALTEYSTMMFYEHNDDYGVNFNDKYADTLTACMLYCELQKEDGQKDTSMNRPSCDYGPSEYSFLSYVKGALMLDAVRDFTGDSGFYKGLKQYYGNRKYKIARPDDLIGALEKGSGKPLKSLFDSWIEGKVQMYGKLAA